MKRNKFSLSHTNLFSADMGQLLPIGLTEVLPGDSMQQSTSLLVRVSPLLAPVMHPVRIRIHHWYVPHRLIWEDWEKFITGGSDGMDASVFPTIVTPASVGMITGSLGDYYGIPVDVPDLEVSALPFRGYNLIFNEWYRDQDLVTELLQSKLSGPDTTSNTALQNCAWEKDYFTTARPWTQKGPEVVIPLQGDAPVTGLYYDASVKSVANPVSTEDGTTTIPQVNTGSIYVDAALSHDGTQVAADLTNVSAANINELRLAFALQRYEEARARYGSRYTEYLAYLGVRSSDARLQRPEYLGGGKQTIQFSEVLQTAEGTDPVGDLKGHGIGAMRSNRFRRFFEEHGYVHSFVSILPKTIYTQGLPKTWIRRTKEDFWQKELEHVGQQEIQNQELYAAHSDIKGVFGYQDRYDEYRRSESRVSGEFRTTSLDHWHMARIFSGEPVLNSSFVTSDPTKRINAVQSEDVLWCMANHSIQVRRQLSKKGTSFIL